MSTRFRMTARKDFRNGAIGWPDGMSAFWPKGETRDVPLAVMERIEKDGTGEFNVQIIYERPEPEANGNEQDHPDRSPSSGDERPEAEAPPAPKAGRKKKVTE